MVVAESATTSFGYNHLLAVFGNLAKQLTGLGIATDAAEGHLENLVGSGAAGA